MSKKVILSLYRTKLERCVALGYKLGTKPIVYDANKRVVYYYEINLGKFLFDRIKLGYKMNKHITNKDDINKCIDDGFLLLRNFDFFAKKRYMYKL